MARDPATRWLPLFDRFLAQLRIQSKEQSSGVDGAGVALDLWGSQRRFMENIATGLEGGQRVFYCLKSRQLGVTTISLAVDLFFLAMYPGTRGALVVDEDRNRDAFRGIIKTYIDSFPQGFFGEAFAIKKGSDNRYGMAFSNNSRLDFLVAGTKEKESFGDGGGYSLAHFTEVGRYGCPDALTSFRQALSENNPNRLYIYESRAAGPNHWQDMWRQGERDVHTIRRFFIGWWSAEHQRIGRGDPRWAAFGAGAPNEEERELIAQVKSLYDHDVSREQLAWYRWRADAEDVAIEVMHAQQPWTEHQAFVTAGYGFFQQRLLEKDFQRITDPENGVNLWAYRYLMTESFFDTAVEELGAEAKTEQWQLRVWEKPVKGARYVIGMDPAYGRNEGDNHAIVVYRCFADKLVQVAEYATNEDLTMHATWVLAHLAGHYADCIINLEISGPGGLVMQEFTSLKNQMNNPFYKVQVEEHDLSEFLRTARWYLYHRPDSMGAGFVYNFKTGYDSKRRAWNAFRNMHYAGELLIRSRPLIEEMSTIRVVGTDISASGRNHDDRVMATSLACYAFKEWRQAEMIVAGETYERAMARESNGAMGQDGPAVSIVRNFLQRIEREKREDELDTRPRSWAEARGLV